MPFLLLDTIRSFMALMAMKSYRDVTLLLGLFLPIYSWSITDLPFLYREVGDGFMQYISR